jgi:probable HAF family extracellular repeat protein
MTDLGTLGGSLSFASGINDAGEVAGYSYTGNPAAPVAGFIDQAGVMTDIGPVFGGSCIYVFGINNSGDVVGTAVSPTRAWAFLDRGGALTNLGSLGPRGVFNGAYAVNDAGAVVGESAGHPFLYNAGVLTDLGLLPGAVAAAATGINTEGQIVGWSTYADSGRMEGAFLDSDGVLTDLGTLPALAAVTIAHGINDAGQVVGEAGNGAGKSHAFLFQDGVLTDLNDLMPPDCGWVLESAMAINGVGQIVGYGTNPNGQTHAFLLTASPEASGLLALDPSIPQPLVSLLRPAPPIVSDTLVRADWPVTPESRNTSATCAQPTRLAGEDGVRSVPALGHPEVVDEAIDPLTGPLG